MQGRDTNLGQDVRWASFNPDFQAQEYDSPSDIDLSTVKILKRYDDIPKNRVDGLTREDRQSLKLALRSETVKTSYPSQYGEAVDGGNLVEWTDLSDYHIDPTPGRPPEYRGSNGTVFFDSDGTDYLDTTTKGGTRSLYTDWNDTGIFTLAIRFRFIGTPDTDGLIDQRGDGRGVYMGIDNSTQVLKFEVKDGSGNVIYVVSGTPSSGYDTDMHDVVVSGDGSQVELRYDDQTFDTTSFVSDPGDTESSLRIGANHLESGGLTGEVVGLAIDSRGGKGDEAINWIKGGAYAT
jgi:hypothetical protein